MAFDVMLTVSSNLVTVPFHQVVRATTPGFTVLICLFRYGESYTIATYLSLILVIAGVGVATYGDYYYTLLGFSLTLLGAFLAAVKTVVTNRIQTGSLRLSALEILYRMGPLALTQSLCYAYATGEISSFHDKVLGGQVTASMLFFVFINGVISFGLNVASFTANRKVGALTMTVAANIKQILAVVLSIIIFGVRVGILNALGTSALTFAVHTSTLRRGPRKLITYRVGIVLTLLGGIWYARVGSKVKKEQDARDTLPLTRRLEDVREKRANRGRFYNRIVRAIS